MSAITHEPQNHWKDSAAAARAYRHPAALTATFAFLRKCAVKSAKLVMRASNAFAEARMQRALVEVELYRNRYTHASKNDDELPIVEPASAEQAEPIVFPRVALARAAGAVVAIAKKIYPAVIVLSLVATALAATMALRLAIWLPLYWH
jgi:hypothetical protein